MLAELRIIQMVSIRFENALNVSNYGKQSLAI